MIIVSSPSCLCPVHWSQLLSPEWRCSWSSANRRGSTTSEWSTSLLPSKVRVILAVWRYIENRMHNILSIVYITVLHRLSRHMDSLYPSTLSNDLTAYMKQMSSLETNTLRRSQDGGCFANVLFKCIFIFENVGISIKILWSLFLVVQLTINQHWFKFWLGPE